MWYSLPYKPSIAYTSITPTLLAYKGEKDSYMYTIFFCLRYEFEVCYFYVSVKFECLGLNQASNTQNTVQPHCGRQYLPKNKIFPLDL